MIPPIWLKMTAECLGHLWEAGRQPFPWSFSTSLPSCPWGWPCSQPQEQAVIGLIQ